MQTRQLVRRTGRRGMTMMRPVPQPFRSSVLLVDDCIAERDLYESVLSPEFEVMTAARGDAGVELATQARPDAIVLDVLMPGQDGWETCQQLKRSAATAHIPVILLTGAEEPDLTQHARRVGAAALLTKPCPADRLSATIHRTLGPIRKTVWS